MITKKEPEIFLSEFYSDDGMRTAKVYHKAFGGGNSYLAKCIFNGKVERKVYGHNEIDVEAIAENWVLGHE